MATVLTTRETAGAGATVKNAPLTNEEVDLNFISITTNKLEASNNLSDLTDVTAARDNLGISPDDSVEITGGTITGITDLEVEDGGTGASSAAAARSNLGAQAQVSVNNETASTSNFYPTFVDNTTGDLSSTLNVSDSKLYYQPSTGTLNATVFNSLSDVSVKTNVNEIDNGLDVVNAIAGVEFDWKDNGNHSAGVIAQELEKVLPHLVSTSDEGMKSVNYAGLTAYLLSAIKELSSRVR